MTIPKKKHSGSRGRGKRVSIYLPEDVAEMIVGKPDINMSRVVREALLVHFGKIENVENYGRALQKLSALEIQLHTIKEVLSSFCRSAAKHVDLVFVPTKEWDQVTERIAVSDREDRAHEESMKKLRDQVSLSKSSSPRQETRSRSFPIARTSWSRPSRCHPRKDGSVLPADSSMARTSKPVHAARKTANQRRRCPPAPHAARSLPTTSMPTARRAASPCAGPASQETRASRTSLSANARAA